MSHHLAPGLPQARPAADDDDEDLPLHAQARQHSSLLSMARQGYAPGDDCEATLFLGNLSTEADEHYIKRLISSFAIVKKVQIHKNPELHALVTVTSYDDADVVVASLHLRYCMAPQVPLLVLYHRSSRAITEYGRRVWAQYAAAMSMADASDDEEAAVVLRRLMAETVHAAGGDVKEDGSSGTQQMLLPTFVDLQRFDTQRQRVAPPPPPPDIRELGSLMLAWQQQRATQQHQQQVDGSRPGTDVPAATTTREELFGSSKMIPGTYQSGLSMIPGVDAPASSLPASRILYQPSPNSNSNNSNGGGGGGAFSSFQHQQQHHHQHQHNPHRGSGRGGGRGGHRGGGGGNGHNVFTTSSTRTTPQALHNNGPPPQQQLQQHQHLQQGQQTSWNNAPPVMMHPQQHQQQQQQPPQQQQPSLFHQYGGGNGGGGASLSRGGRGGGFVRNFATQ